MAGEIKFKLMLMTLNRDHQAFRAEEDRENNRQDSKWQAKKNRKGYEYDKFISMILIMNSLLFDGGVSLIPPKNI